MDVLSSCWSHLKFDSIHELVERRYWWPTLRQDLKYHIQQCTECQLDQSTSNSRVRTKIHPIPSVALPFERWGLDFVQDLKETKSGNRHIITAIDYATRWVVAKAVPNRDAVTVASFLYELMMNYGSPFEIFTDRGSAFLSEGVQEFEKLQKIRHHATTPYHPQTNGMVERMHAMLGHAITTLTQGRPEQWDEYLNQTVFALRVRKHAVTKKSPFYLLYGVEPRLPGDMEPIPETQDSTELTVREFDELGQHRAAAYHRSKAQAEVMRRRNGGNLDSEDYCFKVGEMVKLKHHSKVKFEFDWKGPYVIADTGYPGTYWLMEPSGRRLDSTTNETDLAPWLHNSEADTSFFDGTNRGTREPFP
ncbi:hypothetical protein BASA61_007985 [Batrachochytrium salamandrivorans]|nr:hypothetical protein BASA61_007985 [Batrachochytrium salamandrivorans]